MVYINITNFVLISELEKDHSMIETHFLKNVIFFQTIISLNTFVTCSFALIINKEQLFIQFYFGWFDFTLVNM